MSYATLDSHADANVLDVSLSGTQKYNGVDSAAGIQTLGRLVCSGDWASAAVAAVPLHVQKEGAF